ncbi:alanine racemase [Phormidium pseudopriestleyi FRX01]|uniref:Alanine racemase n=1 Tax=Phormidium pseudopriestleyi FRX01 TaxID=1759528 RepID=A0ABS3FYZ3_9CYAN|nr:alanine racemase [Phormidium pseudopriestleyi]MBO0352336.1 alanine racemase [Phormidium pseudopriestleyi FRX01]
MLSWEESQSISSMRCDRAWVEVDVEAIAENVRQIQHLLSPKTDLMAVIKADAYGHGAVTVAQTVLQAGAKWLGVATIPEGIELREAGITAPVQVLGATYTPDQLRAMVRWRLEPTLCTPKQAFVFSETLSDNAWTVPVHVKIDTGMSRLGAPWQEAAEFVKLVDRLPHLELSSIYSHLATADSEDPTVMQLQHQRFQCAIRQVQETGIPLPRLHFANSAATLSDRQLHYDMVRVGLGIYGLYPAPHLRSRLTLQPALQVKARVTHIKAIAAGTGVSYGHRYIADCDMRIAAVGIGYADGVPRNLSNQMQVLIRGQKVRQIGSITMDQMMLDVSNIPDLELGEVVTLLGRDGQHEITADDWADKLGTISWEILCGFKHRLPRIAVSQSLECWEQAAT